MSKKKPILGVIGGTGLAAIEGLDKRREVLGHSPFGSPSGDLVIGEIAGTKVVFLARHGEGHKFAPRDVPYQANIWAMKEAGVTHLISLSAVGSLREDLAPGRLVVVDDFFDRTGEFPRTFFTEPGLVVHVSYGEPLCMRLSTQVGHAANDAGLGAKMHFGGTYVCIPGPRFSTRAESRFFQATVPGAAVVGMTALREGPLAREAEMHHAVLALVTDWDAWRDGEEAVNGEMVQRTIAENAGNAERIVVELARRLSEDCESTCTCGEALARGAIHTHPDRIPRRLREQMALLISHRLPPVVTT